MAEQANKPKSGWLNILVDYGPLLVFLGVYRWNSPAEPNAVSELAAIIAGTGAFMIARQMDRDIVGRWPAALVNGASMYALNGAHHRIYEGMPFKSFSAYSTTKAGIHGLTLWLAGDDGRQNLPLAFAQAAYARADVIDAERARRRVRQPLGRAPHRLDDNRLFKRLLDEIYSTSFHRFNGHGNVAMPSHDYRWYGGRNA